MLDKKQQSDGVVRVMLLGAIDPAFEFVDFPVFV